MNVSRIVPNINTADPAASKPFYEGVLGLDTAMDMG
jgi:catechol 2,3-dioxygenase-like lactoylglutathione lyase family enzyme